MIKLEYKLDYPIPYMIKLEYKLDYHNKNTNKII